MSRTFRRLAPFMDRVPYRNAPRLKALLGSGRWLLDVGGGTGRIARRLGGRHKHVVILDVERNMLKGARTRGFETVVADARFLPVRSQGVDAVLMVDALHHFPDHPRVLTEAARVLAPAGRLVVEEFDPGSLSGRVIRWFETVAGFGSRFHTPDALADLAGEAGLRPRIERFSRRDYALVAHPSSSKH